MNDVGEVRHWLLTQLLDCHITAQRHGFADLVRALDETLDLLSEPSAAETLELGRVLPFARP